MTAVSEGKVEEPVSTIKQKCLRCLKGPNLIKTIIVLACTAVVVEQLTTCIRKLVDVPITTYTHFDFNKTILYPSLTFCREPPYKYNIMMQYGLYAHPRYTSTWTAFNFSAVTLDQLWNDITYTDEEFFAQYGLDGFMDNVTIAPTMGFMLGRCYTMTPKAANSLASKATGYSITLQHNAEDVVTSTSIYPPGYHVFVHYRREPFTEVEVYNGGLIDYLYVNTGETLDVKLTVDHYIKISNEDDPCSVEDNYSANGCTSQLVNDRVVEEAGCSGPWMQSNVPRCYNSSSMRQLIAAYMSTYNNHNCYSCPRICSPLLYNAYVTERQRMYSWDNKALRTDDAELQAQMYLHFNSMMVSVYEESYSYDWNLFISDLGGSVGFLLGLSVIGLMTIFGKLWSTMISPFIKHPKTKRSNINDTSTIPSGANNQSLDLAKAQDLLKKCNDWNANNLINDQLK